ncbi:hypothetical protein O9992_13460 [Vibrio lentus]|nr:hypothetical protein [Vibrio lentus]
MKWVQQLRVEELNRGIIIQSTEGNDACVAMAEHATALKTHSLT